MSARIAGTGWVTPLGSDLRAVWQRIRNGERAEPKPLANPESGRIHHYLPVPPKLVEHLARNPRLRRSSAISYFAVAAALAALEEAGLEMTPALAARTAVVFAVSDGGVIYTRKFYEQLVKQSTASPLLFPETVYNAPASHLAAQIGIDGASYTLVGDNSVGLAALKLGEQLLETDEADYAIVVGCEEIDWVLCEAYRDWRLAGGLSGGHLHSLPPRGAMLAEAGAAVVLGRAGRFELHAHEGVAWTRRCDAAAALAEAVRETADAGIDLIIGCANGTFIDAAEAFALRDALKNEPPAIFPKAALGEAPGASALLQVIAATLALAEHDRHRALVPVLGFNQQASAALVSRAD
jgi:3-oxoacyl-(acyl-carrier-protein) synthase